MSVPRDPSRPPTRAEAWIQFWKEVVVPTADSLENFAWKAAWFGFLIKLLFFCR
jgi:hypothetical protein